jgi:tripartite-type tricarboxylate transporter receptor subunit TctC
MIASMRISVALVCLAMLGVAVHAQPYPSRPIRLIVSTAPGSGSDIIARLISVRLSENLGQQVVVDNRVGASGMIGAETVARATPDGHTFWLPTLSSLISTTSANRLHLAKEYAPIGLVATTPFVIAVTSTLPVRSIAELIAYAKANPGQLMYASGGTWTSTHICIELLQQMAGLKMLHVPYKGLGVAMADLMSGQVQLACPPAPTMTVLPAGKVRVLGVTSLSLSQLAPGIPPIANTLAGYEMPGWYGAVAPQGTAKNVIARINQELARTVTSPDIREKLLAAGAEPSMSSPEDFTAFLNRESQRLVKLFADAGVNTK